MSDAPKELNVFASYKMPRVDESGIEKADIAKGFHTALSDVSGKRIKVHYAGNFADGEDWRDEIINTISKCDMFILLYTGSEEHWEFCLLEAGLFQAKHPDRPLVVLHSPQVKRPTPLAHLKAVEVTVPSVKDFLRPILYKPWNMADQLSEEGFTHIATDLVRIFNTDTASVTNFDLVPSFVLEMTASEAVRSQLDAGKVPESAIIKGGQNWQMLFEIGSANQNIKWGDLMTWSVKPLYDFKFARMASTAIKKNTPGGCFIRPLSDDTGGSLFRITLRRYEEYANKTGWRFFFTAAPIDIPIFGIGDAIDSDEIRNYHLLNVCWYTRRKLILQLRKRAEELASSASASMSEKNLLVENIKDEIVSIDIQSFIRKVDHPKALAGVFPLTEIQSDQEEWMRCTSIINGFKHDSKGDFERVLEALQIMEEMNRKYFGASASGFARAVAAQLKGTKRVRKSGSSKRKKAA